MRSILALVLAGSIAGFAAVSAANAAGEHDQPVPPRNKWSFSGPFGKFDRGQLQRGFKVYKEVCAVCHGLDLVSFRNLTGLGYSEAQVKAIASEYKIKDGPNDAGDMFERDGRPADRFPRPWANENAARAAYGSVPPDFSVIAKARTYERGFPWFIVDIFTQFQEQGVDYITALILYATDRVQRYGPAILTAALGAITSLVALIPQVTHSYDSTPSTPKSSRFVTCVPRLSNICPFAQPLIFFGLCGFTQGFHAPLWLFISHLQQPSYHTII